MQGRIILLVGRIDAEIFFGATIEEGDDVGDGGIARGGIPGAYLADERVYRRVEDFGFGGEAAGSEQIIPEVDNGEVLIELIDECGEICNGLGCVEPSITDELL